MEGITNKCTGTTSHSSKTHKWSIFVYDIKSTAGAVDNFPWTPVAAAVHVALFVVGKEHRSVAVKLFEIWNSREEVTTNRVPYDAPRIHHILKDCETWRQSTSSHRWKRLFSSCKEK